MPPFPSLVSTAGASPELHFKTAVRGRFCAFHHCYHNSHVSYDFPCDIRSKLASFTPLSGFCGLIPWLTTFAGLRTPIVRAYTTEWWEESVKTAGVQPFNTTVISISICEL